MASTKTPPQHAKRMATLYKQGLTMAQIAKRLRRSRESVRYALNRYYPDIVRPRGRLRDPNVEKQVLAAVKQATNWQNLADKAGVSTITARRIIEDAGLLRSTKAHFTDSRSQETRQRLITQLQTAAKKLGSTPTAQDCLEHKHGLRAPGSYVRMFGTISKAQRAAGLKPNKPGYRQMVA